MGFVLTVENFRALRRVRWDLPPGVCVLVGPNGSGKTTLLSVLDFLRITYERDLAHAFQSVGGMTMLRHFDAHDTDYINLGIEADQTSWTLSLAADGPNIDLRCGEIVRRGDKVLVSRLPYAVEGEIQGSPHGFKPGVLALRLVNPRVPDAPFSIADLDPLVARLQNYQLFQEQNYALRSLRKSGASLSQNTRLSQNGLDVFSVLRNWRDKRATRSRWEFVLDGMREAFPNQFEDLEFDTGGQSVFAQVIQPQKKDTVPHYLMSDGWFVGLLHLCAVASAEPGGIVAIDEPENALHPHAIKQLLQCFRDWSNLHDLRIILATHSTVILNDFRQDPSRLFVMQQDQPELPVPIDRYRDPEWLAHFSLGDLYANENFGAPHRSTDAPPHAQR